MRILLTGASGFVAPYLARELESRGHEIVSTDIAPPRGGAVSGAFETCDISSAAGTAALVRSLRPDGCIHLAGISFVPDGDKDPGRLYAINIAGTLNLLDAFCAAAPGARFLFISSVLVYGNATGADDAPVSEDAPVLPLTPYAISKVASEAVVRAYGRHRGLDIRIARPSNHTGPGQSARFVAPSFIAQAREILDGARDCYEAGNLDCCRDFSDVRDIVRAYADIFERGESGATYNVGSGTRVRIGDLLRAIAEISGAKAPVRTVPALCRPTDYSRLLDVARLRALGWAPRLTLDQTIRDMLAAPAAGAPDKH